MDQETHDSIEHLARNLVAMMMDPDRKGYIEKVKPGEAMLSIALFEVARQIALLREELAEPLEQMADKG